MSDSDSSSLSSAPPSEDELEEIVSKPVGLARYFKPANKANYEPKVVVPATSPPPPKREPSPPHEFKLIDNDAIAVIVMFRSRFADAFSRSCPHFGPGELEAGVREDVSTELAERLLCSLIALCLNRKKDPEREHYGRALEEAVQTHSNQWPRQWEGRNPLHGGGNFKTMTPEKRLVLLRTLVYWSLSSSTAVQAIIKEKYKQTRQEDDKNQPLSVQPWGRDGYKRRYWLIEGQDDTHFQVYRENNGVTSKTNVWFGVAESIDDLKTLAGKLESEGTSHARQLQNKIVASIPRFEAGEEKRRRRDYRLARKAAFSRPEPGFSLYEGRTRGKRMKYTFSDDEDDYSDALSTRRSTRQSGVTTPAETGPVVTASGRQVKPRQAGLYGESLLIDQRKGLEDDAMEVDAPTEEGDQQKTSSGRPQRSQAPRANGWGKDRSHIEGYNSIDEDESDGISDEHDWEAEDEDDDEEEPELNDEDDDEASMNEGEEFDGQQDSLVVQLRYRGGSKASKSSPVAPPHDVEVVNGQHQAAQPQTNGAGPPAEHTIELQPTPNTMSDGIANGTITVAEQNHDPKVEIPAAVEIKAEVSERPQDTSTVVVEPLPVAANEPAHADVHADVKMDVVPERSDGYHGAAAIVPEGAA